MPKHPNFYENVKEANMRLRSTVVLYDKEPCYVLCISDHKPDGIFRIYLDPIGQENGLTHNRLPVPFEGYPGEDLSVGQQMDSFMSSNPDSGLLRKMMNSPLFDRFRPFPLGMCNIDGDVIYVERAPSRHVQQGLTDGMLKTHLLSVFSNPADRLRPGKGLRTTSPTLYDTIMGNYPSAQEAVEALNDPDVTNSGIGFHRLFSLVRGPVNLMFLAYKTEIIGWLPNQNLSCVKITNDFMFLKESIRELEVFGNIITD